MVVVLEKCIGTAAQQWRNEKGNANGNNKQNILMGDCWGAEFNNWNEVVMEEKDINWIVVRESSEFRGI